MGHSKLFPSLSMYKKYTNVVSYTIEYHVKDPVSFGKVESLGLHSVKNREATFV